MIDEKMLIEDMLNNDCINFRMDFNTDTEDSVLESLREFADRFRQGMIELVQKQPKVGEWIPVSERLPSEKEAWGYNEKEGTYEPNEFIVMIEGAEIPTVLFYDTNYKEWSDGLGDVYNVVAWMPLPEPYKE